MTKDNIQRQLIRSRWYFLPPTTTRSFEGDYFIPLRNRLTGPVLIIVFSSLDLCFCFSDLPHCLTTNYLFIFPHIFQNCLFKTKVVFPPKKTPNFWGWLLCARSPGAIAHPVGFLPFLPRFRGGRGHEGMSDGIGLQDTQEPFGFHNEPIRWARMLFFSALFISNAFRMLFWESVFQSRGHFQYFSQMNLF